ncbi:unnamed protein product [Schistosoma margrebowiei]|uniref:Uncharacterized protein n=1 Tax=Schistosoma margrebowiei TaxID=48269 RepID=A0A3P8CDA9_9TREM|nr:unnamed protein product [Schistosoma margrebowiei]
MGLVSWMCLHLRVDVCSGTRTQYLSLQASGYQDSVAKWITRWRLKRTVLSSSPRANINSEMQVHPADESQTGRNARPGFHC